MGNFGFRSAISIFLLFLSGCANKFNELSVSVSQGFHLDKIKIEVGRINFENENDLLQAGLDENIFDGEETKPFKSYCKGNDFLIRYDTTHFATIRHFVGEKCNEKTDPRKYHFTIYSTGEKLMIQMSIPAEHNLIIEKPMYRVQDYYNKRI